MVEDCAADDEPVDAGVAGGTDGIAMDAAVDFDALVWVDPFADLADFGKHFGHEFLPAEAGFDAHDENHVSDVERGKQTIDGRSGLERDADPAAEFLNLPGRGRDIAHRFHMKRN